MGNTSVFQTNNLKKTYGSTLAIDGISINVEKGQTFGILGPNGSGKTTTLSIATGILHQDEGDFFWFGELSDHNSRKKIGSLIEIPHFYPYLTLIQNLKLIARIKERGEKDIQRVLKLVKLYDRHDSKFKTLSLGMKQRLGIAASMLGDPEVLVLDEPTNGLDPEGIAEVRELIMQEASRGKTIIMASHILSEVEKVCSHVAILKKGKLLEQGDVKSIIEGEIIIEIDSDEKDKLRSVISECDFISSFWEEEGMLRVFLTNSKTSSDLNSYVSSKGVILSRLVSYNKSLESQFLELVKD